MLKFFNNIGEMFFNLNILESYDLNTEFIDQMSSHCIIVFLILMCTSINFDD